MRMTEQTMRKSTSPRQRRRIPAILAALVLVLGTGIFLGGCGSSSGDDSKSAETETTTDSSASSSSSDEDGGTSEATITPEQFEQIENGMTYDEVTDLVGSEGEKQSESNGKVTYNWRGEDGGTVSVIFDNGQVTTKSQFGLLDSTDTATMDKYNQVQEGMTYDEVKEIMGSDGELMSSTGDSSSGTQVYIWYSEGGGTATVSFSGGVVTMKAQSGLDE